MAKPIVTLLVVLLLPAAARGDTSLDLALARAVASAESAKVADLLAKGARADSADERGVPHLVRAAELGLQDLLFQLLAAGADPNRPDGRGRTALMAAASFGDVALVTLLLQAGADPLRSDDAGSNALDYAEEARAAEAVVTRLREAGGAAGPRTRGGEPARFVPVSVWYATNRKAAPAAGPVSVSYAAEVDDRTHFGKCEVSLPAIHVPGEVESPSIFRLELSPDPAKHVVLQKVTELDEQAFLADIDREGGSRELLVFVHGFNVSFEDAARRTAQMAYDLKFEGVPVFFSWPSHARLLKYADDAERIRQSIPAMSAFITDLARRFRPTRIHVVAHSMGTYGLTRALASLADAIPGAREGPLLNQLVLAAPDIDAELFQNEIAPRITRLASRVSLYSSSRDVAMTVSRYFNKRRRAGDSSPEALTPGGVDSIDVTKVDSSLIGHSYYGSNDSIVSDIKLVLSGKRLEERTFLAPRSNSATRRTYWLFRPPEEVALPAGSGR
jgi:esterase/lipase superfamily enzyme